MTSVFIILFYINAQPFAPEISCEIKKPSSRSFLGYGFLSFICKENGKSGKSQGGKHVNDCCASKTSFICKCLYINIKMLKETSFIINKEIV